MCYFAVRLRGQRDNRAHCPKSGTPATLADSRGNLFINAAAELSGAASLTGCSLGSRLSLHDDDQHRLDRARRRRTVKPNTWCILAKQIND